MTAFEHCRHTNPIVNQLLGNNGSLEDVIVALCVHNDALMKKLIDVESYAPKKIAAADGKVYVWHCPTDLIPFTDGPERGFGARELG